MIHATKTQGCAPKELGFDAYRKPVVEDLPRRSGFEIEKIADSGRYVGTVPQDYTHSSTLV